MNVKEVMSKLTIEEKVLLLQAKDDWHLNGVERLDIPSLMLTDGPSGVRVMADPNQPPVLSTTIPTESILSASWNPELIEALGKALGEECHYFDVGILLGPGVNAKRSPLGGRNFEYYSEDPYLSGKLATAMIDGVQSEGVGTSLKHYVANDQETRRFTMDAKVDERTLREICLKPFEMAIKDAKPWTVMGAYPKVNGIYACENSYLLEDILRAEYGYEGVMLTDWGAAVNKVASHKNGLDLEAGSYERYQEMLDAVNNGEISMDVVDLHVERVLTLLEKILAGRKSSEIDWAAHHALAQRAIAESIVLLKNEDNVLPFKEGTKLAVIGKLAKDVHISGGGSSSTSPKILDEPLEWIEKFAKVSFALGYETEEPNEQLIREACDLAKNNDVVIAFIGTLATGDSEGSDRVDMKYMESQLALIRSLAQCDKPLILINSSGSAMELASIEKQAKAILHVGLAGEGIGSGIANILFGKVNPSGKLTETFPICLENTPVYPFYPGKDDNVVYREELLVGYRYYDTKKIPVLYPFGYGVSYTTFAYTNLKLSAKEVDKKDTLRVTFDITNTGDFAGAEVVQLYVKDEKSYLMRPEKELKAFTKVFLEPGETKTEELKLNQDAFAYYVPHMHSYAVESGNFMIQIAASSQDIRLEESVYVHSADEVRLPLDETNTMGEFYNDSRYADKVKAVFAKLQLTEDSPAFPMAVGMTFKSFPRFLDYFQVPREESIKLQQSIMNTEM